MLVKKSHFSNLSLKTSHLEHVMSTFKVFLFQNYFYFMYINFFPACMYVYHNGCLVPRRPEEGIGSPEIVSHHVETG